MNNENDFSLPAAPADEDLSALFRLSGDAVLGVRAGAVVFANAAARALLGQDCVGLSAAALLPDYLLEQSGDYVSC